VKEGSHVKKNRKDKSKINDQKDTELDPKKVAKANFPIQTKKAPNKIIIDKIIQMY